MAGLQNSIAGVVLAGGRGSRMGGEDKGLVLLAGRPMVAYVLERLAPQTGEILISANRNAEEYAAFGYPVLADRIAEFAGPLAGLHAAMRHTDSELVASVPCDTPFIPHDLIPRLNEALCRQSADLAVVREAGRLHPVFCLCRRELADNLERYLRDGGHKVSEWQRQQRFVEVDFSDQPGAFSNINTPEDLQAAAARF